MDKEKILNTIKNYLNAVVSNKIPVVKAYLFGSTIKNSENEDSDIDVAIFLSTMNDETDVFNKLMRIRRDFDLRIEPHPFLATDIDNGNPFINNIVNSGLRIY
jgi:predicted nucleotidyltransferase